MSIGNFLKKKKNRHSLTIVPDRKGLKSQNTQDELRTFLKKKDN